MAKRKYRNFLERGRMSLPPCAAWQLDRVHLGGTTSCFRADTFIYIYLSLLPVSRLNNDSIKKWSRQSVPLIAERLTAINRLSAAARKWSKHLHAEGETQKLRWKQKIVTIRWKKGQKMSLSCHNPICMHPWCDWMQLQAGVTPRASSPFHDKKFNLRRFISFAFLGEFSDVILWACEYLRPGPNSALQPNRTLVFAKLINTLKQIPRRMLLFSG